MDYFFDNNDFSAPLVNWMDRTDLVRFWDHFNDLLTLHGHHLFYHPGLLHCWVTNFLDFAWGQYPAVQYKVRLLYFQYK